MKIGILSDTHDLLRPEVIEKLRGCDRILHGGDFSSRAILDQLEQIAPVKAVRGNNDREWAEMLPVVLELELDGIRICMAHKKKDLPGNLGPYDLVVCGHTHQYAADWQEDRKSKKRRLFLNPGSCGPRRFHQPITMAVLQTGADGFTVERTEFSHQAKETVPSIGRADMKTVIETVIRETQKGRSPDAAAKKYGLDPALAEQIARLYVTHPGVTADGIMAKMGL